jgi:soluble lytic murein transglycosylase-like protein
MRQILFLTLLWPSVVVCAEKQALLAQARFLDTTNLDRFYDAAALKAGLIHLPEPAKKAPRAFLPKDIEPARTRRQVHRVIVPVPEPSRAYRRTFRLLASNPDKTDRYDEIILRHSQRFGLNPRFVKAIIAAESEFLIGALSPKGAHGLMQVMPATAREMGVSSSQLRQPEGNILAGTAYLSVLFRTAWKKYKLRGLRFHDAPVWVLQRIIAAYNAGPRFLTRMPLLRETRHYVRKVMLFYNSGVTDLRRPPEPAHAYPQVDYMTAQ